MTFTRTFAPSALLVVGALLLLTPAGTPRPAAAATALPGTPVGRLAAAWIETFNRGDAEAMGAFLAANVAPEDLVPRPLATRLETFRAMTAELGRLEVVDVLDEDGGRIVVAAKATGTTDPLAITFLAKGARPYLGGIRIEAEPGGDGPPAPPAPAGPPLGEAALVDSLDAFLAGPGPDGLPPFSGVAHLVSGDRVVYSKAFGRADRAKGVANTTRTRFNIGSINKAFTATAIAQLAAAGKIGLDDPLIEHLPDYPDPEIARMVTIGQLVAHRSGLGDIFGPRYDAIDHRTLRTLTDYLGLFRGEPLLFEPGTRQSYSNAGYVVLGLVVEKVSGLSYDDYVARHVFAPLGMEHTGPSVLGANGPDAAVGYTTREGRGAGHVPGGRPGEREGAAGPGREPRENTAFLPGRSSSAGGGLSTVEDLVRFARGLEAGKIVPAAWVPFVLGGKAPVAGQAALPRGGSVAIAGGAPGLNAELMIWLGEDRVLVVMANQDPPAATRRGRTIADLVRRTKFPAS